MSSDKPIRRQFNAHSRNADGKGIAESVRDHIQRVTEMACEFAMAFGMEQQAKVAGLLHDLGKYSDQFQRRLASRSEPSRDHWSIGALFALSCYKSVGLFPALAIRGHHVGLDQLRSTRDLYKCLGKELNEDSAGTQFTTNNLQDVWQHFQSDDFKLPSVDRSFQSNEKDPRASSEMLDVRMLFSALVDADYLATEGHFAGTALDPYCLRKRGDELDIDSAIAAFDTFVANLPRAAEQSPMQQVRDFLRNACLTGADRPTGAYTLSAPTGSGKTLAMLAFALHHARKHQLRRIVLVLPFLNIIEQTVNIYREVFAEQSFGRHFVLEDHSLADNSRPISASEDDGQRRQDQRRRVLAENWDAPIIITTNVQLLESLHSQKPGRCRKLHRLARSVILFDEVQTLPPHLAKLTLGTLSRLADPAGSYGSTVVFATATQPAFAELHGDVVKLSPAGWQPEEIVPDASNLFALASARVKVSWRHDEKWSFSELVENIAQRERVLCIVNLKRHAIDLVNALEERGTNNVVHLSTNLCPSHRFEVLRRVRELLRNGSPIRLIATQCVEAGVDVSFPTVMRSLAPLEAIAQAAGRCNRSGEGPAGEVIVFRWPMEPGREESSQFPPGYKNAVEKAERFLRTQDLSTEIIHSPEKIRDYYRMLYAFDGRSSQTATDEKSMADALAEECFEKVANLYRLIDNDTLSVIVPYSRTQFKRLRKSAEMPLKGDGLRDWFRLARPLAVSIYRPENNQLIYNILEPVRFGPREEDVHDDPETTWYWLLDPSNYNRTLGLTFPKEMSETMIV